MRTIQDIYNQYDIMPNLREHMFRVAAVGEMIVDHGNFSIDKDEIISALLLHDIGNIIKFELEAFPDFLEPQGLNYWQNIQQKNKEKYGESEYIAHEMIVRELGMSGKIISLVKSVGFSVMCNNVQSNDWQEKICNYADLRVNPYGTASLNDRMKDGRTRYRIAKKDERWDLVECAQQLEKQIFEQCDINPEDITDDAIAGYMEKYLTYQL